MSDDAPTLSVVMPTLSVVTPTLSVLMPMRNAVSFLAQAMNSLRNQDLPAFEVIAVNDGSTDDTARLFRELADSRFRLYAGPAQGISAALNLALELARGEFVARMDADDECRPDRLRAQVAAAGQDPRVVAVSSAYDVIDEDGKVLRTQAAPLDDLCSRGLLLSHNPFGHGSMLLRRAAALAAGGYQAAQEPAEDYGLWLRLAAVGSFRGIAEPLYRHRSHGRQVSVTQADQQHAAAAALAATARSDLTLPPVDADDVRRCGADHESAGEMHRQLFLVAMRELSLELVRRRRWREASVVRRGAATYGSEPMRLRSTLRLVKALAAARRSAAR